MRCSLGSTMHTSDIDLGNNVLKSSHPPIITDRHYRPSNLFRTQIIRMDEPLVVQTKEVLMGRARRTVTDDGCTDVVHHVGLASPPIIYSSLQQPSSPTTITIEAIVNDRHEIPYLTTVDPPDFLDRNHNDGSLGTSKQV
jgi:hypothetical protein